MITIYVVTDGRFEVHGNWEELLLMLATESGIVNDFNLDLPHQISEDGYSRT
jgi:hypothetical protein